LEAAPLQAVLVAPGVKDRNVLAFKRDALKDKDASPASSTPSSRPAHLTHSTDET
jgi:hypothetical protein